MSDETPNTPVKDPNRGRRFLVFQRNEIVDSRRYEAGEVPNQWFTPERVALLTADGTAREATDEERDAAITADGEGRKLILPPKAAPVAAPEQTTQTTTTTTTTTTTNEPPPAHVEPSVELPHVEPEKQPAG